MGLTPGGERRIFTSMEWMVAVIETEKKNAPGMNSFRMHFEFSAIIIFLSNQ